MAIQWKLNKKLIVCIILFFAAILSYDFVIQNLRWANTLYLKKAILVNSIIVDKNTSETSEGIFDNYYLEFMIDSLKMKNDSVTIWRNKNQPYNIGDSMAIIVSTGEPADVEAFENLNNLKLNIVFSIVLIIIVLYSVFEIVRQVSMFKDRGISN